MKLYPGAEQASMPKELTQAFEAIDLYRRRVGPLSADDSPDCGFYTQCDIQARSCRLALEELAASVEAAEFHRAGIINKVAETMSPGEWESYRLHVYFYKNAFVRLFSILDKLGYFVNWLFALRTERVKHRFSYYTVLRQMRHVNAVPVLERKLTAIKEAYGPPMSRLRKKRNVEVHLINSELEDDMSAAGTCRGNRSYIEDLDAACVDLKAGRSMAAETIETVFADLHARLAGGQHPTLPRKPKGGQDESQRTRR